MRRLSTVRSLLLFALSPWATLPAQVTLPKILANHMVVQRDLPVHVWGLAEPQEKVSVTFRGESVSTVAGQLGRWSVYLRPGGAGGPFQMTVKGTQANAAGNAEAMQIITVGDVLVGDVWVASGQSNMGFPMREAATASQDLPIAANPRLRLLTVKMRPSDFAEDDADTDGWVSSSSESAAGFSAVAWYFAREIEQREHVPVGIINASWGGSPAESWIRLTALGEEAELAPLFASRGRMTDHEADLLLLDKNEQRQREQARAKGKPEPVFPWQPSLIPVPQFSWRATLSSWSPGLLWNGMIAPLTPFPIRGVIWYQGESNAYVERVQLYDRVMRTLIEDWRRQWGIGDFPFLYVQLANYKTLPDSDWPSLRKQQLETLGLRDTAMVVTIDIGDPNNIHPTDKLDVGLRLSRAARAISYGEAIEYSGPVFREATPEGSAIRAWFEHAKGLRAKNGDLSGFEVAGIDGRFSPAAAIIDGSTVVATSPEVSEPAYVRYGWADNPECNLYNSDELPASPFTSVRQ